MLRTQANRASMTSILLPNNLVRKASLASLLISAAACGGIATSGPATAPTGQSRTTLSFAGRAPGPSFAVPTAENQETVRVGNHVLVITSAKVVLREALVGS